MSRINTNVQSLIAQRVLSQNQGLLSSSLERLSTGLKINRGKDDPAGLIASEALRSEIKATNTAIQNSERADQVVNIAEGGLQEASSLLTELQGLVTATASDAGISAEEKKANQLQIDSILQTIDRIAGATSFQGIKLLNGNFDFKTSAVAAGISDFRINAAKFSGTSLDVDVRVTNSATTGAMLLSFGATSLTLTNNSAFVVEIAGSKGAREFTFSSATATSSIVAAINTFKDVTGVSAVLGAGNTSVNLRSIEYGSGEFVSVKSINATGVGGGGLYQATADNESTWNTTALTNWAGSTSGRRDFGQDVQATINGIQATSIGKTARVNTDFLDVEITLTNGAAQTLGAVSGAANTFTIIGGGADFQLAGKVDIAGRVSLGIQDVAARKLGNANVGFLSELAAGKSASVATGDISKAQKIINASIDQISGLRGRLGAFQKNTIGATIRSLGVSVENSEAAQSVIRDADFAKETASLTRSQILVSASTNILGLANQTPQSVLQLLG